MLDRISFNFNVTYETDCHFGSGETEKKILSSQKDSKETGSEIGGTRYGGPSIAASNNITLCFSAEN